MKFRKKPIVVDAVQFVGLGLANPGPLPPGVCAEGTKLRDCIAHSAHVHTLEGPLVCSPGDWIIRGVRGEYYPCKPDVFAATYEAVRCYGCGRESTDDEPVEVPDCGAWFCAACVALRSKGDCT